eukprot:COSAG06_NODE_24459_length_662_cov_0.738899_1_plen_85_part_00
MSCARLRWCLVCVCLTACDGVVVSGGSWRMLDDAACACCIAPCVLAAAAAAAAAAASFVSGGAACLVRGCVGVWCALVCVFEAR